MREGGPRSASRSTARLLRGQSMRRFFIRRPHGWGRRPELQKWWVPLLGTAVVVAAAFVAENYRSAGEHIVSPPDQAARAGPPLPVVPAVAPPVAVGPVAPAPVAAVVAPDDKPTLCDAIALVEESRAALQDVRDYTAEFTKE